MTEKHDPLKRLWELENVEKLQSRRIRELNGHLDLMTDKANSLYAAVWIVGLITFVFGVIAGKLG